MSSFIDRYVDSYMNNMFNQGNGSNFEIFQMLHAENIRKTPSALDVHRETCQKCTDASNEEDLCFIGKKRSILDDRAAGIKPGLIK